MLGRVERREGRARRRRRHRRSALGMSRLRFVARSGSAMAVAARTSRKTGRAVRQRIGSRSTTTSRSRSVGRRTRRGAGCCARATTISWRGATSVTSSWSVWRAARVVLRRFHWWKCHPPCSHASALWTCDRALSVREAVSSARSQSHSACRTPRTPNPPERKARNRKEPCTGPPARPPAGARRSAREASVSPFHWWK